MPMMMEKQRLAKELGMPPEAVGDYMRRWRNAEREAKALHKFTEVRTVSSVCAPLH
jgi:predicted transcriptional regulator